MKSDRTGVNIYMDMNYTLHSIIRTKEFYPGISELLFKRPMHYRYKPGDKVHLRDFDKDYYIASGIQEPWARIIIDDIYINTQSIRLEAGVSNDIPTLIGTEPTKTVMICNDLGIGPALSFCGTYPADKFASIIYTCSGEGVNIEWLKKNQNVVKLGDALGSLNGHIPIESEYNYYICMSDNENASTKDYLLSKGVDNRVIFCSTL